MTKATLTPTMTRILEQLQNARPSETENILAGFIELRRIGLDMRVWPKLDADTYDMSDEAITLACERINQLLDGVPEADV